MELNEKLIFGTVLRSTDESDEYGICRKCARFKTDVCPNAARCFSTLHKPYFESIASQEISATSKQHICDIRFNAAALKS